MRLNELRGKNEKEIAAYLGLKEPNKAIERFALLGLPDKKNEAYRYFDVEKLFEPTYHTLTYIPKAPQEAEVIEITDGVVTKAPKGVRIYYDTHAKIADEHFDPLYYLSHALSPYVIKIDLDGDAQIELIHRYTRSDTLITYRVELCNQPNRHATIYEHYEHDEALQGSLVLWGYDITVAPDSTLRIVKTQTIQGAPYAMTASHDLLIEKNGNGVYRTFDLGEDHALQLFQATLMEHAHIEADHLLYLNAKSKRGTVSQIIHRGKHSSSNQEAKNILDGASRGIFDALIKVEESGRYTKAHQNSKAILLDEGSYMASKPQLEIYIDELEASHGSTTGQLNPKELFYLRSRGIKRIEARKMLIAAFANTLIEKVKDTRHQERIRAEFDRVFYANTPKES